MNYSIFSHLFSDDQTIQNILMSTGGLFYLMIFLFWYIYWSWYFTRCSNSGFIFYWWIFKSETTEVFNVFPLCISFCFWYYFSIDKKIDVYDFSKSWNLAKKYQKSIFLYSWIFPKQQINISQINLMPSKCMDCFNLAINASLHILPIASIRAQLMMVFVIMLFVVIL